MSFDFSGQCAIVTGGSRGIGRATVELLAAARADVTFTYHRREDEARSLAEATGATAIQCSQGDAAAIQAVVDATLERTGRLDLLVNNAGMTRDKFLMLMPEEDWDAVVDTNLNGLYRWCKAACRPMLAARRGSIVNVSSISALAGVAGQSNYAATKGAILAMTRSLAAELGPKGVRVNAVVPGFIETDMTAKMPRDILREQKQRTLERRLGRPEEIARAIAFLASDWASYIMGQALVVDGGLTATA